MKKYKYIYLHFIFHSHTLKQNMVLKSVFIEFQSLPISYILWITVKHGDRASTAMILTSGFRIIQDPRVNLHPSFFPYSNKETQFNLSEHPDSMLND